MMHGGCRGPSCMMTAVARYSGCIALPYASSSHRGLTRGGGSGHVLLLVLLRSTASVRVDIFSGEGLRRVAGERGRGVRKEVSCGGVVRCGGVGDLAGICSLVEGYLMGHKTHNKSRDTNRIQGDTMKRRRKKKEKRSGLII